jgi:hypothetical protein
MLKTKYTKLKEPADTAWDESRFKWGRHIHWKIRYFFQGIKNIIRWIPVLYKDKDWDDFYITTILQKKLEHQRAYLVHANRHTDVSKINQWITVVLNLIELEHDAYYESEYGKYHDQEMIFNEDGSIDFITHWEKYDEYLAKYPAALRRVLQLPENKKRKNKWSKCQLCMLVGYYNQQRCRNLIFEILKRKSSQWWD